jgi:hypothetical protein
MVRTLDSIQTDYEARLDGQPFKVVTKKGERAESVSIYDRRKGFVGRFFKKPAARVVRGCMTLADREIIKEAYSNIPGLSAEELKTIAQHGYKK